MLSNASSLAKNFALQNPSYGSRRPININSINQQLIQSQYGVRGHLNTIADQFMKRIKSGEKMPFKDLIQCSIGNPFSVGKTPLSFTRQVVACIEDRSLLDLPQIPAEVKDRVNVILNSMTLEFGGYTKSAGIDIVRQHVAEFINKRDGYPTKPDDIFLSSGVIDAIVFLLTLLINNDNVGIMMPFPTYPIYASETILRHGKVVPFYLKESDDWSIDLFDLQQSFTEATKQGIDIRAMVIVNPCNPTGRVLSAQDMRTIIEFCDQNKICIIADEVYQDCVYNPAKPFISFKKMVSQVKSGVQLISLHSISKGFMGECGHRGGYMELYHFPIDVKEQISKMSTYSLCPNAVGQVILDTMAHPPESDECKSIWDQQKANYIENLKVKSEKLYECLNKLPGISTKKADGGWYLFPSLKLPLKALEAAKSCRIGRKVQPPDFFWCLKLLEETGVQMNPGSGFGQVPGTSHFRSTFLAEGKMFDEALERITEFQNNFMKKYD
ncbi:aminotransferase, classes I and II family protein [Trichomonas vaginalis G3]|uniref:Aminotransferase, classes I and II family protein n=1 Tax=Trichomonas vaginalis (strain ATCC PRA-98 / G3) TaxID=412133 RepID=A2E3X7_TRIV3|nr:alanine aminotransferase family [Trichomonas vaginalis G3]EAY12632.1 aminotransferase, classes I and II family protein [Trichomonas vaginalis G3]KAI5546993.1 alanine aminotransferase family [Trichomonas vaginalis G3]|eukprot:XP_001324855.1 aminotransferase, classes I and II family protein [Trichomonas vaginalis G3]